ncbi:MAG: LPS export ABC transporter ATP-binding protein [Rickettsiales bacterium]|nr:LPS export ABC transporter ATP-binding protein [Rickettsiales bacterium]OUV80982.1 MAG: LPS export ABC transporter ATP-binding protein [Rickettsiales bacterium TMED131]
MTKKKMPIKPKIIISNKGLSVKKLGKMFKNRPILRDISIKVKKGEIVGLLGPNGAGKTTCFYIIMGLLSADYGSIYLNGTEITNFPVYLRAKSGLGYLPQESSIFRGMTVEQNIRSVLQVIENDRDKIELMLDDLLAEFSISHLRRASAITLSGGERRRVEIARALASQPSFLLLDEPLAGIDPVSVSEVSELVSQVKEKNVGVLVTDHNVRDTLNIVERAYIIHNGEIMKSGKPKEIAQDKNVRQVYLGANFNL